jgi:hypothetical protein
MKLARVLTTIFSVAIVLIALIYWMPFLQRGLLQGAADDMTMTATLTATATATATATPTATYVPPTLPPTLDPSLLPPTQGPALLAPPTLDPALLPPTQDAGLLAPPAYVPTVDTAQAVNAGVGQPAQPSAVAPVMAEPTVVPPMQVIEPTFVPTADTSQAVQGAPLVATPEAVPATLVPTVESAVPTMQPVTPVEPPTASPISDAAPATPEVQPAAGIVSGAVVSASPSAAFVLLTDALGQLVATAMTAADGSFALPNVPPGTYMLTIDDGVSLLAQQPVTVQAGAAAELPAVILVWGDINRDGRVDELDVVTIASLYGQPAPQMPVSLDITGDGVVGLGELMLVAEHFRNSGQ